MDLAIDAPVRDWVEISSPLQQRNYPRRLSLRRGPREELAWMLVSERSNGEKKWEHFGPDRVVMLPRPNGPHLVYFSRRQTPVYFRDLTFRPGAAAEFLKQIAMVLLPRQELEADRWMGQMVKAFVGAHPQWDQGPVPWPLFFLRVHLPLFQHYPVFRAEFVPGPLVDGLRLAEPEALVWWLTGTKGNTTRSCLYQHLIEALGMRRPDWGRLLHLKMLRGLGLTPEQIRELVAWPSLGKSCDASLKLTRQEFVLIRRFLRRLPEKHRFALIKENYFWPEATWSALAETAKRWFLFPKSIQDVAFAGAKSINEFESLADYVDCQRDNHPISLSPWAQSLVHTAFGRWKLEVPYETQTLAFWGKEFRNCAASLAAPMVAGKTCVVRALKDNTPRYLLEIQERKLVQFLGPANQRPDPDDRVDLVSLLSDHGLLDRIDLVV